MVSRTVEEKYYIVPEIEVRVHESWVKLVQHCQLKIPYGDLKLKISNSMPTKLIKEIPNLRFDKQQTELKNGITYYIENLDVKVHECWINLIKWCQDYFVSGVIEFRLIGASPTELLFAEQNLDFSKSDTIPPGMPLKFSKIG